MATLLEELTIDECLELLSISSLGRLGVIVDDHPEVFPINHVIDPVDGCVVFPTNASTKLRAALNGPVAYEVDGIACDDRSGWSVMVVGDVEEVTEYHDRARAAALRVVLWAVGPSTVWLRLVPRRITGRRIEAVHPLL